MKTVGVETDVHTGSGTGDWGVYAEFYSLLPETTTVNGKDDRRDRGVEGGQFWNSSVKREEFCVLD